MSIPESVGFPRMKNEAGEVRVFLPEFIEYLSGLDARIFIEEGYGARSGYTFEDYKQADPNINMCSMNEAYQKDVVVILRSPKPDDFKKIKPGSVLISMLHFPTRPLRVARLKKLGIKAISLDSVVNDNNIRLVENMKAVAWNGLEAAFDILEEDWIGMVRPDKKPVQVLILGTGMVGKHAVEAATKFGNLERNNDHIHSNGPGVVSVSVGRNITSRSAFMKKLFGQTDILVDATQRRDTSKPVVPNDWIAWLPKHTVIVDLAVDPYILNTDPPIVRGIEGIPQGNLDQYIFTPEDQKWDSLVPESISTEHRRTTATCYSWPGVHPEACMRHYARQLRPLLFHLMKKGYDNLSLNGDFFERALYRATLKAWLKGESATASKKSGSE